MTNSNFGGGVQEHSKGEVYPWVISQRGAGFIALHPCGLTLDGFTSYGNAVDYIAKSKFIPAVIAGYNRRRRRRLYLQLLGRPEAPQVKPFNLATYYRSGAAAKAFGLPSANVASGRWDWYGEGGEE